MKDLLQTYADGQVEMFQQAMEDWDKVSCGLAGVKQD
jgi:sorting nexin-4